MEGLVTPVLPASLKARKFIVVDLDGTLCNSAHRDHLAVAGQWDEFHGLLSDDEPHTDVKDLVAALGLGLWPHMDLEIIALTGRNEKYRMMTEAWLLKHSVAVDYLLMRPDFDWRPDVKLKPELLHEFISNNTEGPVDSIHELAKSQVWFILEDRDKVVEEWRNLGFRCWQTQPGGY